MFTVYQVSYYRLFPGATKTEEDVMTAFVHANSFDDAAKKVKDKERGPHEMAEILAVSIAKDVSLIVGYNFLCSLFGYQVYMEGTEEDAEELRKKIIKKYGVGE